MKKYALVVLFLTGLIGAATLISEIIVHGTVNAALKNSNEAGTFTGKLYINYGDGMTSNDVIRQYYLSDGQGFTAELIIPDGLLSSKEMPGNGKQINVRGNLRRNDDDKKQFPVLEVENFEIANGNFEEETANLVSGNLKYINVLCRFPDSTPANETPAYFDQLTNMNYPGIGHYWQQTSYGNITMNGNATTPGWYVLPHPREYYLIPNNPDTMNTQLITQDCTAAADADVYFPNYDGINFMLNASVGIYAFGGTVFDLNLDGQIRNYRGTWMPPWAYQHQRTLAHEMGHSFGLVHTSGMYAATYDSYWDPMGIPGGGGAFCNYNAPLGCAAPQINAYHKDALGWIQPHQKIELTAPGTTHFTISRLALPASYRYYLLAVIPINNSTTEFLTIEARRFTGYDVAVPGEGIVIHRVNTQRGDRRAQVVDPDLNGNPNDNGAIWLPGETYYDPESRTTITVNSSNYYGYYVSVTTDPCAVSVNQTTFNIGASGGTISIPVTAQNGCRWSVEGLPPVTGGGSGGPITINDATVFNVGLANPYPSEILVESPANQTARVNVILNGLSHPNLGDVDIILESPNGVKSLIMSDAGNSGVQDLGLTFDQTATASIPQNGTVNEGIYLPTNYDGSEGGNDNFPSPGPGINTFKTNLNLFRGTNPNGLWKLYVVDDSIVGSGLISRGWEIFIQTGWFYANSFSGNGSENVVLNVIPNTQNTPRTATLTVAGQTVTINQSAP